MLIGNKRKYVGNLSYICWMKKYKYGNNLT